MKKPSSETRSRGIRCAVRRARNRWRTKFHKREHAYVVIRAPEVFSLETADRRRATVIFLRRLRAAGVNSKKPVRVDFCSTIWMTAPGTLLFAAELDRMKALGARRVTCTWPGVSVVAQVLQHVGIFDKLRQPGRSKITAENVVFWKVHTGSAVDGATVGQALAEYHKYFGSSQSRLYRGLTEAMTNSRQHAYAEPRDDGFDDALKNWWMFSECRDGQHTVALCDLGMGIPRSLPKTASNWSFIKSILQETKDDDAHRIQAAIKVGATSTEEPHRGKGMMEIRSAIDRLSGQLHIHSNRGYYKYDAGTRTETCVEFPSTSIQGTVILWQVPLPLPKPAP